MKRTALFLSLLIAILKFTQAQPSLGIFSNSIVVTPNFIVALNDTVSIKFDVSNTGNQSFTGSVTIYYSVNDSFQGVLDTLNSNTQIDSFQSFQVTVSNYVINPDKYAIGDNIVVIWPVADNLNVVTTDSGTTDIVVDTSQGIGSPLLRQIKVFYKIGDPSLFINYGNMISQIKDVTCYSILGQPTAKYNYAVNKISPAENSVEIFLLVIRTREGESIAFKILRM